MSPKAKIAAHPRENVIQDGASAQDQRHTPLPPPLRSNQDAQAPVLQSEGRLRGTLEMLGIFNPLTETDARRTALFEAAMTGLDLGVLDYLTIRDLCDLGGIARGDARTALEGVLLALFSSRREGSLCVPTEKEILREYLPSFEERDELIDLFFSEWKRGTFKALLGEACTPLIGADGNLYFQRYHAAEAALSRLLVERFGPARTVGGKGVKAKRGSIAPAQGTANTTATRSPNPEDLGRQVAQVLAKPVRDPLSSRPIEPGSDQKLALALTLLRQGVIITGGPGTGKTSIVFALLRVLLRCGVQAGRIGIAAPTGRAAQRVGESLRQQFDRLPTSDRAPEEEAIRDLTPATIHRLLGYSPHIMGFRHGRLNPLDLDVVIVDEASMVDAELMAGLLDATPQQAKLILLGDADQLPSVEAGAVLGDLVGGQRHTCLSPDWLKQACALLGPFAPKNGQETPSATTSSSHSASRYPDHLIVLRQSFRSVKAILEVAETVNTFPEETSEARQASERLIASIGVGSDHILLDRHLPSDRKVFAERLKGWLDGFCRPADESGESTCRTYTDLVLSFTQKRPVVESVEEVHLLTEVFRRVDRSRLLTVFREGPFGSEGINEVIASDLRRRLGVGGSGRFFPGALVMVTRNDYRLELFNGDTGVVLPDRRGLAAFFPRHDGYLRVQVDELPAPVLAFAVTVHKSQGSEFEEVTLVVPSSPLGPRPRVGTPASSLPSSGAALSGAERILTREIIYTGLTRAKKRVTIWTDETAFFEACRRRVRRTSGL